MYLNKKREIDTFNFLYNKRNNIIFINEQKKILNQYIKKIIEFLNKKLNFLAFNQIVYFSDVFNKLIALNALDNKFIKMQILEINKLVKICIAQFLEKKKQNEKK